MNDPNKLLSIFACLVLVTPACGQSDPASGSDASSSSDDGGSEADTTDDPDPSTTASTTAPSTTGDDDPGTSTDVGEDTVADDTGSSDAGESTGEPAAPTIVEISPADGATGVREDAVLVVQFSEAMDQAATQAAYQSATVPAAAVTFTWNDAGDTLTITPNEPMPYAMGIDPAAVVPLAYDFSITTTATSLAGEPIAQGVAVEFTTLRWILQIVERDPERTGNVAESAGPLGTAYFGDRSNNEPVRYAVSFDLGALAPEIAEVEVAEFQANWTDQSGDPWDELGGATVFEHVAFDTLDVDTFDTPAIGETMALFDGIDDDFAARDITEVFEAVRADAPSYQGRLQVRARWMADTNYDGGFDTIAMVADDLELVVAYLSP